MDKYELSELVARQRDSQGPYLEFFRRPSLSLGLYVLPAGAVDGQEPHQEDEVYVVMEGRAAFELGSARRPVGPGSIIFVAAGEPHRFVAIETTLRVVVLFAPAESNAV